MKKNLKQLDGMVISTEDGEHRSANFGTKNCAYVKFRKGTDIGPALEGLENDLCQVPHWGYVINGSLTVSYDDGSDEEVKTGDIFYWPPGHTVVYNEDSEIVEFSPKDEMAKLLGHIKGKMTS